MKKNMGIADRVIRSLIAIILITLYATNVVSGILGIILVIVAIVFLLTSIMAVCPLYNPLKINTGKKKE
jgi:hypothetical protein